MRLLLKNLCLSTTVAETLLESWVIKPRCAPGTEPPGVLTVEASKIPEKGDQRSKVQSVIQVPGGVGGPKGREEGDRGPGLQGLPGCFRTIQRILHVTPHSLLITYHALGPTLTSVF
ncbi:hypothetical protein DRN74_06290 [Candidatus Micrarchaeota archaeon]|nr:MAG: hypothetical protein DRN74_06290 [Candidatus Micrarchaeota archaeon]